MKQTTRNIVWIFVPVATVLVGTLLLAALGLAGIEDGNVRVSIGGSTHIGMEPLVYVLVMSSLLGFFIFMGRSAWHKFTNRASNMSLMVYSLLLL